LIQSLLGFVAVKTKANTDHYKKKIQNVQQAGKFALTAISLEPD